MSRVNKHSTKSGSQAFNYLDENSYLVQTASPSESAKKAPTTKRYSPSKRTGHGLSPALRKGWSSSSRSGFSIFSGDASEENKENIAPNNGEQVLNTSVVYTDKSKDSRLRKPLQELPISQVPGYLYIGGLVNSRAVQLTTQWNNSSNSRKASKPRVQVYRDLPVYVTPPRASVLQMSSAVSRNIDAGLHKPSTSSGFHIYQDEEQTYTKSSITLGAIDNKENVPPKLYS